MNNIHSAAVPGPVQGYTPGTIPGPTPGPTLGPIGGPAPGLAPGLAQGPTRRQASPRRTRAVSRRLPRARAPERP